MDQESIDIWELIAETEALAGIDGEHLSLRQLMAAAEAKQRATWNYVSDLICAIFNSQRGPDGPWLERADVHPMVDRGEQGSATAEIGAILKRRRGQLKRARNCKR